MPYLTCISLLSLVLQEAFTNSYHRVGKTPIETMEGRKSLPADSAVKQEDDSDKDNYSQNRSFPSGILPQAMPTERFETSDQLIAPQPLRYDSGSRHGGSSSYGMGQSGYAQMPLPHSGGFEHGLPPIYSQRHYLPSPYDMGRSLFTSNDPPESGDTEGLSTTGILPSNSTTFTSGAPGTAFSVLPPPMGESSPRLPIIPPHHGPTSYTPVFGFGSSSPGYSGTAMGGRFQDM